jgi:hypothetical protein
MFTSILNIISAALSIWASKEKTKYSDELKKLREDFYEEYNKPLEERSDAVLDALTLRLRILTDSVTAAIGTSHASFVPDNSGPRIPMV